MKSRIFFFALVATIIGIFLLALHQRRFEAAQSGGEKVKLLMVAKPIERGTVIIDDMLTVREREILQLLADGMSNADVATKLFISQETVKSHVRHILAKLEADTRTQAVAIALREAIID